MNRKPVTVLTGYLGAGKTTLLNRILSENHGQRYAVIINEFGEIGIDNDLVIGADEEVFEMNNGCICCTVRGDLIRILNGLIKRRNSFDAIIVETTGLADPAPVAQTFFVDEDVKRLAVLDSITTVVDSRHILDRLADSHEAEEQIAFADQIILNKLDLVGQDELGSIDAQIRKMNPTASIHRTRRCDIDIAKVIGRGAFDLNRIFEIEPDFLKEDAHEHDQTVQSISFSSDRPLDAVRLQSWLEDTHATFGVKILRSKGIFDVAGETNRFVFQGVHMLTEGQRSTPWRDGERKWSRFVLIGRDLPVDALKQGFQRCAAE